MGQGLFCFECIWHNQCHSNVGLSYALGCIGCWMCIPPALAQLRGGDDCLRVGACNQGFGSSCFCYGQYCLIPDWLRNFSIWESIGQRRGTIYDVNIQNAPIQYINNGFPQGQIYPQGGQYIPQPRANY